MNCKRCYSWSRQWLKASFLALMLVSWLAESRSASGETSVDGTFVDPGLNGGVTAMASTASGIVIGGLFDVIPDPYTKEWAGIARLKSSDGTLDTSFAQQVSGNVANVNDIVIQAADQKIVVAADFLDAVSGSTFRIGRLNTSGSSDSTFTPPAGLDSGVNSVVIVGGKILIGGAFTTANGNPGHGYLARLNPNGTLDAAFDLGADGIVHKLLVLADGSVLVGGEFQTLGGAQHHGIARLKTDWTVDATFNASVDNGGGVMRVNTLALQADGKVLVGGAFDTLCGQSRSNIGRLNTDWSLDTAFNPVADGEVTHLAARANGLILVMGKFFNVGGGTIQDGLAQLLPNGSFDAAFPVTLDGSVDCIAVPSTSKIWLGGGFNSVTDGTNSSPSFIARLNDAATTLSANANLASLTVSSGTLSPAIFSAGVTTYSDSCTADTQTINITASSQDPAAFVQVRIDGGPYFTALPGQPSADLPLTLASTVEVRVVAANGTTIKTYTVKASRAAASDANLSDLALAYNGSLDSPFNSGTSYTATVPSWRTAVIPTVEDPNATVAVAVNSGSFSAVSGTQSRDLALISGTLNEVYVRVTAEDGKTKNLYKIDVTRAPGIDTTLSSLTVTSGTFDSAFEPLTTLYPATVYTGTPQVTAITTDPNATIQVSVNYGVYVPLGSGVASAPLQLAYDGSPNHIDVQVTAEDGTTQGTYGIDFTLAFDPFDPEVSGSDPSVSTAVNAVVVQPDGGVVFGGNFAYVGGQPCQGIARSGTDGTLDSSFSPGTDGVVRCLALQKDQKILIGGDFQAVNGQPCKYLARLSGSGTLDVGFNPLISGSNQFNRVNCVAVQTDGKILAGGLFDTVGGKPHRNLARLSGSGALDSTFIPVADGEVYCVALQADGKILVGGSFNTIGTQAQHYLARINSNGSVDTTFLAAANAPVTCLAVQADGKILVGGSFNQLDGQSRSNIGRLNANGSLDANFNPGADSDVLCLLVQSDGRILVGGDFQTLAGQPCGRIGRLWSNGVLDASFGNDADASVNCLARQVDGSVIVGGAFTMLSGQARMNIGRLMDGAPVSVTASSNASLASLLLSSGTLSPVFSATNTRPYTAKSLTSFFSIVPTAQDPNAVVWAQLNGGAYAPVLSGSIGWPIKVGQNTVNIQVIAASGTVSKTATTLTVSRDAMSDANLSNLTLGNASLDSAFDSGTSYTATVTSGFTTVIPTVEDFTATVAVAVNGGNFSVVSGTQSSVLPLMSGTLNEVYVRVTAEDGKTKQLYTIDVTRAPSTDATLSSLALDGRGINLAVDPNNPTAPYQATVYSDTPRVTAFTADSNATVQVSLNGGDYVPVASGLASAPLQLANNSANHIDVQVTAEDGATQGTYGIDLNWVSDSFDPQVVGDPTSGSFVNAVAVQSDGKIVFGGSFLTVGGQSCQEIARVDSAGVLDPSFSPSVDSSVWSIALQKDQKILIGGDFQTVNGQPRSYLARLSGSGTLDSTFNPAISGSNPSLSYWLNCVTVQPDGKILVGGLFDTVGGKLHKNLARLSGSGTVDSTFTPGTDGEVYCMALQADGKILVAGSFKNVGGQAQHSIVRLNANGMIDSTFQAKVDDAYDSVTCIAVQADGKILVGGWFSKLDGQPRENIARLNANGTLDPNFNPGANDDVGCLMVQADGRILVGGSFDTLAGQPCNRIGRLWSNGALDASFGSGANDYVACLARQADGVVIAGGWFTMLEGQPRVNIGRLTDGAPASMPASNNANLASLLVSSGTLSPVFSATNTNPYTVKSLTSIFSIIPTAQDPTALVWAQLNGGAYAPVLSGSIGWPIKVGPNTVNIQVIAASGTVSKTTTTLNVSRDVMSDANLSDLTLGNASLDSAFASGTNNYTATVASWSTTVVPTVEDVTATVAVAVNSGSFSAVSGTQNPVLPLLSGTFLNEVYLKVTAEDGKTTQFYTIDVTRVPSADTTLSALTVDGRALDPAFDPGNHTVSSYQATVYSDLPRVMAVTGDPNATVQVQVNGGGYVPVGSPLQLAYGSANHIDVQVTAEDGTTTAVYGIDVNWISDTYELQVDSNDPSASTAVNAVAVQPDGKIVFGGNFASVSGQPCQGIARSGTDDTLDFAFAPSTDGVVRCIALQQDKKILIGGDFQTVNGQPRNYFARLIGSGTLDSAFSPVISGSNPSQSYHVDCAAVQTDGKILAGGLFDSVGNKPHKNLARLSGSGTVDATFTPGADGEVYCVALQTDGKILIGGSFNNVSGVAHAYLVRLNPNGTVDTTFQAAASAPVTCLAVQADGKILVGGWFLKMDGQARIGLARLNANGTLDPNFNPAPDSDVLCLMVQADGRILVGGDFQTLAGQPCGRIGRLWPNGAMDTTFGSGADASVNCLARQADGRIVAGGAFTVLSGQPHMNIGRLLDNGPVGTPVSMAASNNADLAALQVSSGTLSPVFSATNTKSYTVKSLTSFFAIMPVSKDPGALVLAQLNGGVYAPVLSGSIGWPIKVGQNTVNIQVISASGTVSKITALTVSRDAMSDANLSDLTLSNGSFDSPFDSTGSYTATVASGSTAVIPTVEDPNATVAVAINGGSFIPVASGTQSSDLPLLGLDTMVYVRVTAEDGKTQQFYTIDVTRAPSTDATLSGLSLSGGALDPVFNLNCLAYQTTVYIDNPQVTPITTDPNATVTVSVNGGNPVAVGSGSPSAPLQLAFNAPNHIDVLVTAEDGTTQVTYGIDLNWVSDSFDPQAGVTQTISPVLAVAIQADGSVIFAGACSSGTSGLGQSLQTITRSGTDGTLDQTFSPSTDDYVLSLALQKDQKILVGGEFHTVNGLPCNYLARLNGDGTLDTGFNPVISGSNRYNRVDCIAVQADGKILLGGLFDTVGGKPHKNLVRLSGSGTVDSTFAPGTDGEVYCVALQPDGKILVAGEFKNVGGQAQHAIVRLNANGTVDSTFVSKVDNAGDSVTCIAVQTDGKILMGGWFSKMDGQPREHIARLNTNGTLDPNFNPGVNGYVDCLLVQGDGRILVGGEFTAMAGQPCGGIGRIWPNGRFDTCFGSGAYFEYGSSGWVGCLARQTDGSIIAGGGFDMLSGQQCTSIGRLIDGGAVSVATSNNANLSTLLVSSGTLSPVFSATNTRPYAVKSLTSSFSIMPTSQDPNALIWAQLNTGAFTPVLSGSVGWPIPVGQNTVNILVVASSGTVSKTTTLTVSRGAMSDANLSWLSLSDSILSPIFRPDALQYSGTVSRSVTAVTAFTNDYTATVQARVNGGAYQVLHSGTAGTPLALNSGSNHIEVKVTAEDARTVKTYLMDVVRVACSNAELSGLQLNGYPYAMVSGTTDYNFNFFGETVSVAPARADANATIRMRVNGGRWVIVSGSSNIQAPLSSGSNLVEVQVTAEDGVSVDSYTFNITRTLSGCDSGFNPAVNDDVYCLALQRDGKILAGGYFDTVGGKSHNGIVRLTGSGALDSTFNAVAHVSDCMAVQLDGKIVVGGWFSSVCSQPRANIARLNADGSLDAAFNPGTDGEVYCVAILPSGKILIGGEFTTVGGKAYRNLARLNGNGTVDTTFVNPGADNAVRCLAVQADGSFLVGGDFSQIGYQSIPGLARFKTNGTLDITFTPNPGCDVYGIAVQQDGNIVFGGWSPTGCVLARILIDGSLDTAFAPTFDTVGNDSIDTVAIQANGKILLGGTFSTVNAEPRQNIARLNPDGTLDETFDPGADGYIYSIVIQPDGKIVVGGWFSTLGGQPHSNLGRLVDSGTNALLSSLTANGATLSPVFTGTNTNYRAVTAHSSISVKPVTADPAATVAVIVNSGSSIPVLSGTMSAPLALIAGDNTVEVQVTAEDGVTVNSYSLASTLLVSPDPNSPVSVSSGSTATLTAAFNGSAISGSTGTFYFQYGSTTSYGSKTTAQSLDESFTSISADLSGLTAGTLYHYRPVITIGVATFYGDDQVFAIPRDIPMNLVTAQGEDVSGFAGAKVATFGLPAINNNGDFAFQAAITGPGTGAINNSGICLWQNSSLASVANIGDDAQGLSGVFGTGGVFTSLGDPVFNNNGQVAFLAGFKTWMTSGTGVWMTGADGTLSLVAATAQLAPGCEPAQFGVFRKIALPDNGLVVFLADMVSGTGSNPSAAAGQGIWAQDGSGNLNLIVSTGTAGMLPLSGTTKVASILAFSGSAGQTRSFNNNGNVAFTVVFSDGTQGVFELSSDGSSVSPVAQTGDLLPAGSGNVTAAGFGSPAINDSNWLAFQAKVSGSNSGLWVVDDSGNASMLVATSGTAAGGGIFAALGDPLFNKDNSTAFLGALKVGVGGVTAANASGIWAAGSDNVLGLVARTSGTVPIPGCPAAAKFLSFTQMALPDGNGVVFLANLVTGLGGVTAANNQGLWTVDGNGQMTLVVRTGDGLVVDGIGKIIASLDFLGATPEVTAQSRSFNSQGDLMLKVTFTDKTQAIYRVSLNGAQAISYSGGVIGVAQARLNAVAATSGTCNSYTVIDSLIDPTYQDLIPTGTNIQAISSGLEASRK